MTPLFSKSRLTVTSVSPLDAITPFKVLLSTEPVLLFFSVSVCSVNLSWPNNVPCELVKVLVTTEAFLCDAIVPLVLSTEVNLSSISPFSVTIRPLLLTNLLPLNFISPLLINPPF